MEKEEEEEEEGSLSVSVCVCVYALDQYMGTHGRSWRWQQQQLPSTPRRRSEREKNPKKDKV